ncbi:alpha/beta hydrolase [Flavihumibacter fluvii]|uniref:alpha/beta hydrolase n=1 Tax=Flavihumibacter fluvii TaxID=2838157 RepID=UPI001BDEE342|nr:alpha/beta hydrolase [Flavihumibacter fluvii]ULQ53458.1 alpha/beta hydrolase [Flavihumibacter fluvii]
MNSFIYITVLMPLLALPPALHAQSGEMAPASNHLATEIIIQKNIRYGQPVKSGIRSNYYLLDIYSPVSTSTIKRPLIIMMHGGGFKLGSKKSNSTPVFSKAFAQQGYICASLNYRLSKKRPLSSFKDLAEGCFDAIQDLQQAVTFLKLNAGKYGIDTNNIILAGNSVGGMMAIQAAYSSPAALTRIFDTKHAGNLSQKPFIEGITAIVNCWGGIYDSSWLNNARIPVVSVHGSKDRVVPINYSEPTVFGSSVMHRQLDQLGTPNQLKIYDGIGHELSRHFNPFWTGPAARKRCRDAALFITGFLGEQVSARQSLPVNTIK